MPEIEITKRDVEALADTLDQLALPEEQRAFLTAVVAVARDAVAGRQSPVTVEVAGPVESFRAQFETAFTSGAVSDPLKLSIHR